MFFEMQLQFTNTNLKRKVTLNPYLLLMSEVIEGTQADKWLSLAITVMSDSDSLKCFRI